MILRRCRVRIDGTNDARWRTLRANGVAKRILVACGVAALGAALLAACGGSPATVATSQRLADGIAAQRAGDYAVAAADYEKVLKAHPSNVYALYDLGDVDQFLHKGQAAMQRYNQVLAIDPTFENALYNMAILESKTDPEASKALFLEVVSESPRDGVARFDLGKVLLTLGETKQADAQITQAIRLEPSLKSLEPSS